jgi:hypothetical protein
MKRTLVYTKDRAKAERFLESISETMDVYKFDVYEYEMRLEDKDGNVWIWVAPQLNLRQYRWNAAVVDRDISWRDFEVVRSKSIWGGSGYEWF